MKVMTRYPVGICATNYYAHRSESLLVIKPNDFARNLTFMLMNFLFIFIFIHLEFDSCAYLPLIALSFSVKQSILKEIKIFS